MLPMAEPRVLCTVVTFLVLPLPRSAVKPGQGLGVPVQVDGPVAMVTASIANGTHWMSTDGWLSVTSTPLDVRAMSTQPRPGVGVGTPLAWVLLALSASRSAPRPSLEPFGRAKLQLPAASGKAARGVGTMLFCSAQPSCGVMISCVAPV